MTIAQIPARRGDAVHVVVETPRGSTAKLTFDPDLGAMTLSRPLPLGLAYPYDWGFVPSTCAADGDPIDAMVMWEGGSFPGVVIPCRLIGVLEVEQRNVETGDRERNDRLIAVPVKSVALAAVRSVDELDGRVRGGLQQFFEAAVTFEGKALRVLGWGGPEAADALVQDAVERARPAADGASG